MANGSRPFHAHIYFSEHDRIIAEALRTAFINNRPGVLFVGRMMESGVGPHPIAQYEVHFREEFRPSVIEAIEASGLRALVHPLTDDDLADHTALAHWIGEPLELDVTTLDPPGQNQGIPRFGKTDR